MFNKTPIFLVFLLLTALYADAGYCLNTSDTFPKEPPTQAGVRNVELPKRKHKLEIKTPDELTQSDTEYILVRDIVSAATAIVVKTSNITINLNGYKIIYLNQNGSSQGSAVQITGRQKNIHILNGEILQGEGRCLNENDVPKCSAIYVQDANDLQIAGLKITYGAQNSSAIHIARGKNISIHDNTLFDSGTDASKTNIFAIEAKNSLDTKIHNNSIRSERQSGISGGMNSDIYMNDISINSVKLAATGIRTISGYARQNRIFIDGRNVTGLYAGGSGKIISNHIQTRVTKKSEDHSDASGACIRVAGAADNLEVASNTLSLYTETEKNVSSVIYTAITKSSHKTMFHNNYLSAIGRSSKAKAAAVTIGENNESAQMLFRNNKIASSWTNILLGDHINPAGGSSIFTENTIMMIDRYTGYSTIKSLNASRSAAAYFFNNKFEYGASKQSIDLEPKGELFKEIGFGWTVDIAVTNAGKPVSNASVSIKDITGASILEGTTNEKGMLRTYLLEYIFSGHSTKLSQKSKQQKNVVKYTTPHKIIIKKNGQTVEKNIKAESNRIIIISLE
ncbi:MAG: hypothetical protein JXR79_07445 [Nitrospirae bacterium]|nr:hypothetical protein [Nitrospirota bacterium]